MHIPILTREHEHRPGKLADPMFTNRHLLKATEIGFGISFDDSFLSLDDSSLHLGPIL